ncbi:MAG: hypothetical protein KDB63_06055 [Nocardioidaceae bacterium]|nr:hypothetical protein [Nocardioidaceae bacterium]
MSSLVVPGRFRGPAQSGNGGWTSGAVAALVDPVAPVEVTLRRPPPLDVPLTVEKVDGVTVVSQDGATVAEGRRVDAAPEPPAALSVPVAAAAEASYAGLVGHPFPTCFVCGTGRAEGDGLRIFPGMVSSDPAIAAATWTPHPSLADDTSPEHTTHAVTWAALDCVSGWASDIDERPMVLGRMTAVVHAPPRVGETHVVVGRWLATQGRKTLTSSGLYTADGRLLAAASHVWFTVDPADFN